MSSKDPPDNSSNKEIPKLDTSPVNEENDPRVDHVSLVPPTKKQKTSHSPGPLDSENLQTSSFGPNPSTSTAKVESSKIFATGVAVQVVEHGEEGNIVLHLEEEVTNAEIVQLHDEENSVEEDEINDVVGELGSLLLQLQGIVMIDAAHESIQFPTMPFLILPPFLRTLFEIKEAVLVARKNLTATDLNPTQSRLLLPIGQFNASFLTQAERTNLLMRVPIKISLVDESCMTYDLVMRVRQMKGNVYIALTTGWNTVLANNNFEVDQEIVIYSYEKNGVNVFYLLPIHPPAA